MTPIIGKPGKPTAPGKNEHLHQTLFLWVDKQPLAGSFADLQAQVDTFGRVCTTERPHQGLPGGMTPQQAWDATPVAAPPRPKVKVAAAKVPLDVSAYRSEHTVDGVRVTRVHHDGIVRVCRIEFRLGSRYTGQPMHEISHGTVTFIDSRERRAESAP
ncbi:MAG: transposase [Propionibacteriaceae bacterium]|nr:transposase [Propionibacteriaceae bacterium]